MTDKFHDHLMVLPEDLANRRLLNGFLLSLDVIHPRRVQALPEAGGWGHVLAALQDRVFINGLQSYPRRHLLLMIDFDGQVAHRLQQFQTLRAALPANVQDRVYLIGSQQQPEQLRAACGMQLEVIGSQLARDCTPLPPLGLWQHPHLQHNAAELQRMVAQVRPFLF